MSNLVDDLGQEMLYLPGTASLVQDIDKRVMVVLRDGRTLIGYLRSLDQFANLLLTQTIERIHVRNKYGDIDRGVFLIRGENVVLCGEVDFKNSKFKNLIQVSQEEILQIQVLLILESISIFQMTEKLSNCYFGRFETYHRPIKL